MTHDPNALTPEQREEATVDSLDLYNRKRALGSVHTNNRDPADHSPGIERDGMGAEIYCGNVIGVKWKYTTVPNKEGDLGEGVQVRQSNKDHMNLNVQKTDHPSHLFLLAVRPFPDYRFVGWAWGYEAMRDELFGPYKDPNRPCFKVPQGIIHQKLEGWPAAYQKLKHYLATRDYPEDCEHDWQPVAPVTLFPKKMFHCQKCLGTRYE